MHSPGMNFGAEWLNTKWLFDSARIELNQTPIEASYGVTIWDGAAWVNASAIKVWDGAAWVNAGSITVWDGASWV